MGRQAIYKRAADGKIKCPYCDACIIPQSVARHIRGQHPGQLLLECTPNPAHYARGLTAAAYQRAYRLGIHTSFHRDEQ